MGRHPGSSAIPTTLLEGLLFRLSGFLANPSSHVLILSPGRQTREKGAPPGKRARRQKSQRPAREAALEEEGGSTQ